MSDKVCPQRKHHHSGPLIHGYNKGRQAFKDGKTRRANPYDADPTTFRMAWHRAWRDGWLDEAGIVEEEKK